MRLYRRRDGTPLVGNRTCRSAQCAGHAERCRIPGAGDQYGGLHESTCFGAGIYGRFSRSLHQSEEPPDEFSTDCSRAPGWYDGQPYGRFGN